MKSEVLHTSYILKFLDVDFNSNRVGEILKTETDIILNKVADDNLKDWTIQFNMVYGNKPEMWIYTSMPSYKSERKKIITIHIPIPDRSLIGWGVSSSQFVNIGEPGNDKGFIKVKIDFAEFNNLEGYIINCLRKAIDLCFKEGFTINGIKFKLKN